MADVFDSFSLLYSYDDPRSFGRHRSRLISSNRGEPFVCVELGHGGLPRSSSTTWCDDHNVHLRAGETVLGSRRWIQWGLPTEPYTCTFPEWDPFEHREGQWILFDDWCDGFWGVGWGCCHRYSDYPVYGLRGFPNLFTTWNFSPGVVCGSR